MPGFRAEAVCDALTARLHARRACVTGAGHPTPEAGDAFNQTLAASFAECGAITHA